MFYFYTKFCEISNFGNFFFNFSKKFWKFVKLSLKKYKNIKIYKKFCIILYSSMVICVCDYAVFICFLVLVLAFSIEHKRFLFIFSLFYFIFVCFC